MAGCLCWEFLHVLCERGNLFELVAQRCAQLAGLSEESRAG